MALRTGLEFAPGTTDDCKKLVGRMFSPGDLLGSYRQAKGMLRTSDVVLVAAEWDGSGVEVMGRVEYIAGIRRSMGLLASVLFRVLTIAHKSAHKVMRVPPDSDAFWLVVNRQQAIPVMCVLYATPYEEVSNEQSLSDAAILNPN